MFTEKCLIDGKEFSHIIRGSCVKFLIKHLKNKYGIKYEDYILKYHYNNIRPLCACGCENKTNFHKGKYCKYYQDHKNFTIPTKEAIEKSKQSKIHNKNFEDRLKKLLLTLDKVKDYYNKYVSYEINMTDIAKESCIDFRTMKNLWREMKFIQNEEEFRRITKKH